LKGFVDFLENLGIEKPVYLIGNHDIRIGGMLWDKLSPVLNFNFSNNTIWYEEDKIGIVCFNSAIDGSIARGHIGEDQFLAIGSQIDKKRDWKDYRLIGALHHHPIPVATPSWYAKPFYERWFGGTIEKTLELDDSKKYMQFVTDRRFTAVLHGHKHIPRLDLHENNLPIVGCGSTVSKLKTIDDSIYMSINVISISQSSNKLTCRVMAERIPGGSLKEISRHEMIYQS
jgi:hypothetical protein